MDGAGMGSTLPERFEVCFAGSAHIGLVDGREGDQFDRVNFDQAVAHLVATACLHFRPPPQPERHGYVTGQDGQTELPAELHGPTLRQWCSVKFTGSTVKLPFQQVDGYVPTAWPDGVPQQLHLDLTVSDLDAACLMAASLGTVALSDRVEEPGCFFVVHADPVGHPFCCCQGR